MGITKASRALVMFLCIAVGSVASLYFSAPEALGQSASHDHDHDHSVSSDIAPEVVGQYVEPGPAILTRGHLDVNVLIRDSIEFGLYVGDESSDLFLWRDINDVVIAVNDLALQVVPEGPGLEFLGVEAGTSVFILDLVEQPHIPWIGWSAEDEDSLTRLASDVEVSLVDVVGPGDVAVYAPSGVGGNPNVIWQSSKALPQQLVIERGTHGHGTWVFTQPGIYVLNFVISTTLTSGESVQRQQQLRFAIGSDADIDAALSIVEPSPTAEFTTPQIGNNNTNSQGVNNIDEQTGMNALWWVVLGAVVLGAVFGAILYRDRRVYDAAMESHDP